MTPGWWIVPCALLGAVVWALAFWVAPIWTGMVLVVLLALALILGAEAGA